MADPAEYVAETFEDRIVAEPAGNVPSVVMERAKRSGSYRLNYQKDQSR